MSMNHYDKSFEIDSEYIKLKDDSEVRRRNNKRKVSSEIKSKDKKQKDNSEAGRRNKKRKASSEIKSTDKKQKDDSEKELKGNKLTFNGMLQPAKSKELPEEVDKLDQGSEKIENMSLQEQIKGIQQKVDTHTDEVHMFELATGGSGNEQILKMKELLEQERNLLKEIKNAQPKLEIKSLLEEILKINKELERMIDDFGENVKMLNNRLESVEKNLTNMKDILNCGQIAFDFEQDVAKYILPTYVKFGRIAAFQKMGKWLEGNKYSKKGKKARRKWENLQGLVDWSDRHVELLRKLKKLRIPYAHPDIDDYEKVRVKTLENLDEQEKKCFDDLITVIKEVNKLM